VSWHVLHSFVIYVGNVYNSSVGNIKKLMDFDTALIICLMSSSSCMVIWFCFLEEICVVILLLPFYLFLAELVAELLNVKIPSCIYITLLISIITPRKVMQGTNFSHTTIYYTKYCYGNMFRLLSHHQSSRNMLP